MLSTRSSNWHNCQLILKKAEKAASRYVRRTSSKTFLGIESSVAANEDSPPCWVWENSKGSRERRIVSAQCEAQEGKKCWTIASKGGEFSVFGRSRSTCNGKLVSLVPFTDISTPHGPAVPLIGLQLKHVRVTLQELLKGVGIIFC